MFGMDNSATPASNEMAADQADRVSVDVVVRQIHALDYRDLDSIEQALNKARKAKEKDALRQAQEEARKVAEKYGVSVEDIADKFGVQRAATKPRKKVAPKYRHPGDPSKTWTGRGRTPVWIREWKEQGGNIEQLRIAD